MKLSDLKSHDRIVSERRATDTEYAKLDASLELADQVSLAVVRYRGEHGLTQTAFGERLGWKQPHVARLERGDSVPTVETLERLARAGVMEIHIVQGSTFVREPALA